MTSPFCWKLPQMQNSLSGNCTFCQGQITSSDVADWLTQTPASVWPIHNSLLSLLLLVLYFILCHSNFASGDLSWIIPNPNSRKKQERPTSTSTSFFTLFTGAVLTIVLKHIHEYLLKKVIEKHSLRSWWYLRASTVVSPADTPIRTPRGFVFLLKGCPY